MATRQLQLEDFVKAYNDKVNQHGDQLNAAGIKPQPAEQVANQVQQVAVKQAANGYNEDGGEKKAARVAAQAFGGVQRGAANLGAALAARQGQAQAQQQLRQALPPLKRAYFRRGGSRVTLILGAAFGDVLAAGAWLFGAFTTIKWLRGLGLTSLDAAPWNWIVWIVLIGVTCFEVGYMPNIRDLGGAVRDETLLVVLWVAIAAVDMGSNFFDLLHTLSGKELPLLIWKLEFVDGTLIGVSIILAALVALGPEPLVRYFTRAIFQALGW